MSETGRRLLTPEERESLIADLIWTFGIEGINFTKEDAEKALEESLKRPLPEFVV